MRAREFISEDAKNLKPKGELSKSQNSSTGLHVFTDANYDRLYTLNRIMMAVASADGIEKPVLDTESWAGKRNTAHPYTEVEHKMLKHAYQSVGVPYNDLNKGDVKSKEIEDVNVQSPIKPFKGYA